MRRVAGAAALIVLVSGCATQRAPVPPASSTGPVPEAAVLLRAMETRRESLHSLRVLARCVFRSPDESRRAKQLILAARPDRLRLEVLSPFGAVFVLTASHGTLAAFAPNESTVYRGTASGPNLARYASVDLPVSTAIDLMLGTPPMRSGALSVVSRDAGYTKLWQVDGDDVRVAWFGAALDPVQYEEQDTEGHVLVRATFGAYAEIDGVRLPTQLSVEVPPSQRGVDLEFREPEVNPSLADALFALETPPGSREIDLDQVVN